ncbi:MAG: ABC transporter substrate-binding protein, partial [Acidimicrobiia bacterium]
AIHEQQYLELRGEVAAIGQSTGSPQTAQIVDELEADNMFAIPLSWYSGWAFDDNTLEQGYNYCFEGMNAVSFMNDMSAPGWTLAIVSFAGEYGQDSVFGAKHAATELGVDIVADLEGEAVAIRAGGDPTTLAPALIEAQPDWVYVTTGPTELAALMGAAAGGGLQARWSGSIPTYAPFLLTTAVAPVLDAAYYWPSTFAAWGQDVPGMQELVDTITAAYPDERFFFADYYVRGWVEAQMMKEVLEAAFDSGDMTQAGILAAGQSIEGFDFGGLAPSQGYVGTPNDFAVRNTAIYDVDLSLFTPEATFGTGGHTGTVPVPGFGLDYVSDVAAAYDFSAPCFTG